MPVGLTVSLTGGAFSYHPRNTTMSMKTITENKVARWGLYLFVGSLSVLLLLKNAWVAEDTFILLRTVNQYLHGNGFRWNPHDRTQVFTSPLWFLLVIGSTFFCKTLYMNLLALEVALHVGLLLVMAALLGNVWRWTAAVVLLSLSQAFFDFTSSGLEYPLIYFLLGTVVLLYLRNRHAADRYLIAACAGLALITRHDLLFILSPLLLHVSLNLARQLSWRQGLATLCVFAAPLGCWTLFSLLYYGVPFPNTAYAKLAIQGVPQSDRFYRGYIYAWVSLKQDIITPALMALALLQGLFARDNLQRVLAASVAVAFTYVTWIGADYMLGRFYAPIYLVAIIMLVTNDHYRFYLPGFLAPLLQQKRTDWQHRVLDRIGPLLLCGLLGQLLCIYAILHMAQFVPPMLALGLPNTEEGANTAILLLFVLAALAAIPAAIWQKARQAYLTAFLCLLAYASQLNDCPWRSGYGDWGKNADFDSYVAINTVSRERYWIYRWTSLDAWLHRNPDTAFPDHDWCHNGERSTPVTVMWGVGMQGYCMPLEFIGFDFNGLVDPLMARMPKYPDTVWVPGGAIRIVPDGYEASLRERRNLIQDPDLARYYDKLIILTQHDDLFSAERLRTILAFNLGVYDHWLQDYVARILKNPPPQPAGT